MNRQRQFPTWLGAVLGTICALFIFALGAHASDHRGAFTEEFHQTYSFTADGRVELENINGAVHISTWDRNEVKVDAVKYADAKNGSMRRTSRSIRVKNMFPSTPSIPITISISTGDRTTIPPALNTR